MAGLVPAISILETHSDSVNCSSSVRCSGEKLSSEISVSTSAPPAVAMHRQAFHVVDLLAHVGEDQLRPIDQRTGLDHRERHAADAHRQTARP